MDWTSLSTAVLAGAFTLLGIFAGAFSTRRVQRDVLKFEADLRRAEKFEEAAGNTKAIIAGAEPTKISLNFNSERSFHEVTLLQERWHPVRTSLVGSSLLHNREEVREAAEGLSVDVGNLLTSVGWLVQDMSTSSDLVPDQLKEARDAHEKARQRLEELIELLRSK